MGLTQEKKYSLLQALLLWLGGTLGFLCVLPYTFDFMEPELIAKSKEVGLSLHKLLAISAIQNAVFLALMIFLGLHFSKKVGFTTPFLDHLVGLRKIRLKERFLEILKPSLFWGLGLGALILAINFALSPWLPEVLQGSGPTRTNEALYGFLASFYGAINEEIYMRLGLLSLLIFGLNRIFKQEKSERIFWSANLITAFLFALGHLPATKMVTDLTSLVVFRGLFLNGIPSLVFGHLYRKHGLETAMLCHFFVDIVLHVLTKIFS